MVLRVVEAEVTEPRSQQPSKPFPLPRSTSMSGDRALLEMAQLVVSTAVAQLVPVTTMKVQVVELQTLEPAHY